MINSEFKSIAGNVQFSNQMAKFNNTTYQYINFTTLGMSSHTHHFPRSYKICIIINRVKEPSPYEMCNVYISITI